MLTQLEARVIGVSAPPFVPDGDPSTDPIQIHSIDGLGPVAATVNTVQYGSVNGEFYNGTYTGKRNIVLNLGLNPNWFDQTIESLRRLLISYFLPGSQVKLIFTSSHMPTVKIEGYVESFEPNIFSKDPEIAVSIICPQPYFVATAMSSVSGTTTGFSDGTTTDVNYEGDAACGYTLDVTFQSGGTALANGEVRVTNNTPKTQLLSVKKVNIDSGDYLRVSTVVGDKFANQLYIPSKAPGNLLGSVVPGSIWAPLVQGTNKFQVQSSTPGQTWTLSYYALYGSI